MDQDLTTISLEKYCILIQVYSGKDILVLKSEFF